MLVQTYLTLTATFSVRIEISWPVNHIDLTLNDLLKMKSIHFLFVSSQYVKYWDRELFNLKNWVMNLLKE